jgi:hypothetical protein
MALRCSPALTSKCNTRRYFYGEYLGKYAIWYPFQTESYMTVRGASKVCAQPHNKLINLTDLGQRVFLAT